jgi:N-acetylmuramic acid 6-phosphate etherase
MLRLGRIHDRLMVDMRVSNKKLRARAVGIVAEISRTNPQEAEAALDRAHNNIKLATLIAMGMSADEAAALLAKSHNNLRAAITARGGSSNRR